MGPHLRRGRAAWTLAAWPVRVVATRGDVLVHSHRFGRRADLTDAQDRFLPLTNSPWRPGAVCSGGVASGLYPAIKAFYQGDRQGDAGLARKILAGLTTGGLGSAMANPTDLIKIRMQGEAGRIVNGVYVVRAHIAAKQLHRLSDAPPRERHRCEVGKTERPPRRSRPVVPRRLPRARRDCTPRGTAGLVQRCAWSRAA